VFKRDLRDLFLLQSNAGNVSYHGKTEFLACNDKRLHIDVFALGLHCPNPTRTLDGLAAPVHWADRRVTSINGESPADVIDYLPTSGRSDGKNTLGLNLVKQRPDSKIRRSEVVCPLAQAVSLVDAQ
jgi:hypothetical protein